MSDSISVRCPNKRPHGGHSELCGRLMGAMRDGKFLLYCEMCKQFFETTIMHNGTLEMVPLSKNKELKLKSTLKMVE